MRARTIIPIALKRVLVALFLAGCKVNKPEQVPSTDMVALRDIVTLDIPTPSGKYEVFGTPESDEGIPGPTDYVTLVAELDVSEPSHLRSMGPDKKPHDDFILVPKASRSWLSEPFKSILTFHQNGKLDLRKYDCDLFSAKSKKDGHLLSGFLCLRGNRALIYLELFEAQG